jgi:hypothetical protein
VCRLLSSPLITTIIRLPDVDMWYIGSSRLLHCLLPRCTGCTTFVPAIFMCAGTPQNYMLYAFPRICRVLYRVYHRICVSFSNGPWTVVIKSWFKPTFNRYKWYTYHETQLPRGFPVYHYVFFAGTPNGKSSIESITYGVPGCTANAFRSQAFLGSSCVID